MDEIKVAVKYNNRRANRIYRVTGSDFSTMKDAIKATGSRFDGINKYWILNKAGLDAVKKNFQMTSFDFYQNLYDPHTIRGTGNDGPILSIDARKDDAQAIIADLQAAYNKSDDTLIERLDYWREEIERRRHDEMTLKPGMKKLE